MKLTLGGRVLCPKCHYPTEYLDYFDEEHKVREYEVYWRISCPKCHETTIIKETYTLKNVEKVW